VHISHTHTPPTYSLLPTVGKPLVLVEVVLDTSAVDHLAVVVVVVDTAGTGVGTVVAGVARSLEVAVVVVAVVREARPGVEVVVARRLLASVASGTDTVASSTGSIVVGSTGWSSIVAACIVVVAVVSSTHLHHLLHSVVRHLRLRHRVGENHRHRLPHRLNVIGCDDAD